MDNVDLKQAGAIIQSFKSLERNTEKLITLINETTKNMDNRVEAYERVKHGYDITKSSTSTLLLSLQSIFSSIREFENNFEQQVKTFETIIDSYFTKKSNSFSEELEMILQNFKEDISLIKIDDKLSQRIKAVTEKQLAEFENISTKINQDLMQNTAVLQEVKSTIANISVGNKIIMKDNSIFKKEVKDELENHKTGRILSFIFGGIFIGLGMGLVLLYFLFPRLIS